MAGRARPPRGRPAARWCLATVTLALVLGTVVPAAAQGAYPPLPPGTYGGFLVGLAAPQLAPGASGSITLTVHDPLALPIANVTVTLGFYAFNAYPGNATGPLPAGAPYFSGSSASSPNVTFAYGQLAPNGSAALVAPVAAPSGSPEGAYAVRASIAFAANATEYRLESRGFFDAATWDAATSGPNGTTTLNVSRLGISGVVPETAVLVRANPFPWVVAGLAGAGIALAAAGAFYVAREGRGSTSGTHPARDERKAARAFGKSRTSDGD